MQYPYALLACAVLLVGCAHEDVPLPPVAPSLEDLSTWAVPELVQPPVAPMTPGARRPEPPATKAEQVMAFMPGTTYQAAVAVSWPLDIVLEPGEQVRNIVGGDRRPQAEGETPATPRLEVKEGASGDGETFRPHVFITATEANLAIGLIVTTTRRTYLLTLKSVKESPIRVVRWTYPGEGTPAPVQAPGLLPDPEHPTRYHVGYQVESSGRPPDWLPRQVLDDGKKVYILYPEVALFGIVPVVRMIGPQGPQLVNVRQLLNVVIIDQLAARLELRVGVGEQAETVTITRGALQTMSCPGDSRCPVWPTAAAVLAERGK
jgi:type IV secretion system protein TrbG